jgi:uncharacterized membrane protein
MLLAPWVTLNATAWVEHWDPYPFILPHLALSFQAAYAAPFIMRSQNRQQDIDRVSAENDHREPQSKRRRNLTWSGRVERECLR